ncbi:VOC family protein [Paenibacillus tarimensis]
MGNRVVAFEISSQDAEKQSKFYADVFGWDLGEPNWGYYPVKTGSSDMPGIDGGISQGPSHFPAGVRLQIEVDSIEDSIAKAVEHGAKVVQEKMDFGEFALAYIVDPLGVHYGLIENK